MFPASAGMIQPAGPTDHILFHVPRKRGDDPDYVVLDL